jgi:hypothetical protein
MRLDIPHIALHNKILKLQYFKIPISSYTFGAHYEGFEESGMHSITLVLQCHSLK